MNINEIEKIIEPGLKWERVSQISNIPFKDFKEIKELVKSGELSIGIDFEASIS